MKTSLYAELKAAGVETDNHESDLYFKDTPESRAILERHETSRKNATRFRSQIDGLTWWDVPFAYLPWWEARCPDCGGGSPSCGNHWREAGHPMR